jgi:lipopolysaccharide transport system ATP-binding protein
MSNVAISVENLSKSYRIAHQANGARYKTLREDLMQMPKRILSRFQRFSSPLSSSETFWALKDISFEIKQGEVVGIIGRNGAGKSTLLKILSRITEPTSGQAKIYGRVGSLLEVGTGFHQELTGRENIFLNGAILGMSRAEIRARFDEIVAFAEIEKFLDTPVKRYSSGMYVRLAFAVAAHLDPEMLLIDEVLAVGDSEFQKKCLGKMSEVARAGRTVLFVSHNMAAVTRLCHRGIVLNKGVVELDTDADRAAKAYLHSSHGNSAQRTWSDAKSAPGNAVARLKAVRVFSDAQLTDSVDIRRPVTVEMEFWNFLEGADLIGAFSFFDEQGSLLFVSADWHEPEWGSKQRPAGLYKASCSVPGNFFAEGQIRVSAEVSARYPAYEIHILEHDAVAFLVVDKREPGSVAAGWGRPIPGLVRPQLDWRNEYLGSLKRPDPADVLHGIET